MSKENQIVLLQQMIKRAEKQLETATKMLSKINDGEDVDISSLTTVRPHSREEDAEEGEIIEGVFDGVNMIGNEGRSYTIPPNYASKSKLVEGDILKLTILDDGSFLYKQIGPVERKRMRGALMQDEDTGEYSVMAQGNTYKVLAASITYFKGEVGDEVIILVPADKQSSWAAVENVIKEIGAPQGAGEEREAEGDALDRATADLL